MRVYRCRKGVILTEICGTYLLVAAKGAREYCSAVREINETAAFIWKRVLEGDSFAEVIDALGAEYVFPDYDTAEKKISEFMEEMVANGYFTVEKE